MIESDLDVSASSSRIETRAVRRLVVDDGVGGIPERLNQQWLVANGLGGFSSGTISGALTWKYHGLLVSSLPAPLGRVVMLSQLSEYIRLPGGERVPFGGDVPDGTASRKRPLIDFALEDQLPCWRYEAQGVRFEKRLFMARFQNTVHVCYTLLTDHHDVRIELCPAVNFRGLEDAPGPVGETYGLTVQAGRFEIAGSKTPPLRIMVAAAESSFRHETGLSRENFYSKDAERGMFSCGELWSPGCFSATLDVHTPVTFTVSTESWAAITAMTPAEALLAEQARRRRLVTLARPVEGDEFAAELVLAADAFIVSPASRAEDAARARASGEEFRSVVAGYHWFTDWGRDTMISLEGLTLSTGRFSEAAWILRMFAHHVRDGLIPNFFPEGENDGVYHTADATLWFFHAVARYVDVSGDRLLLRDLLPTLRSVIDAHVRGTRFGIGVDSADGLLRQGAPGYALTWMDAQVSDWVVTPRRGKAVEINALWYNALRLLEQWLQFESPAVAAPIGELAGLVQRSFNDRFWNEARGCLYDVVDGEKGSDGSIRPNQLLAISLPHAVLREERWEAVLAVVEKELLTPVGLRSLAPSDPEFKASYTGDRRSRDAAYHQGTVWAWLIGPFIDAWIKQNGVRTEARRFLHGFQAHMNHGCIGSISEIFDAEAPFRERGCVAQAWSVAEVLRCWMLTASEEVEQP